MRPLRSRPLPCALALLLSGDGATAADIEALIGHVRDTVQERHGVRLDTEVQFLGEPLAGGAVP